jgi:ankyrin repeat protein
MLLDAYLRDLQISGYQQLQQLQNIGRQVDIYLQETLEFYQQIGEVDEMSRICIYVRRINPERYISIFPALNWPHIGTLLHVFQEENDIFQSWDVTSHYYQRTLQIALDMQASFPLADGSSLLHCLAQVVFPIETDIIPLSTIIISSGTDITSRRNDGKSAIGLAVQWGNNALVSMLLETYASLSIQLEILPLLSKAAELHHHDVMETLSRFLEWDKTLLFENTCHLLITAFRTTHFERQIHHGNTAFVAAQRTVDLLIEWGDFQILSLENPHFQSAIEVALTGGNDDILGYCCSSFLSFPAPAIDGMVQMAVALGERAWVGRVLQLTTLDDVAALRLLRCAIECPIDSSMELVEMLLNYYAISDEEYILDLVKRGSQTASLISKVIRNNPPLISRRFGMDGKTLLHHAMLLGKVEIGNLVCQHAADVNFPDANGNTPLHTAIESTSNDACITWLLNLPSIDINIRNTASLTPILYAVHLGNLSAVKLLLEHGADVRKTSDEGYTVLHLAYARYCKQISTNSSSEPYLVSKIRQLRGREALNVMVQVLEKHGADGNAVEHVMGFNARSYFEWLLEMEREKVESTQLTAAFTTGRPSLAEPNDGVSLPTEYES